MPEADKVSVRWLYEHKHDKPPVEVLMFPGTDWATLVDVQRQNSSSSRYRIEILDPVAGGITRFATDGVDTFGVRYRRPQPTTEPRGLTEAIGMAFYQDTPRWAWDMQALQRATIAAREWEANHG